MLKIYILSIERRTDRRERQKEMFARLGIENYEYIPAVDYEDFDSLDHMKQHARDLGYAGVDIISETNSLNYNYDTLVPCCLAQIKALEYIIDTCEDDYILYMEDDIDLLYKLEVINRQFMKTTAYKPDAVHLFSWNHPWDGDRLANTQLFLANHPQIDARSFANIYSREFMIELVKNIKQTFLPLDAVYPHIQADKTIFFAYPAMAIENETCLDTEFANQRMQNYFFRKQFLSKSGQTKKSENKPEKTEKVNEGSDTD